MVLYVYVDSKHSPYAVDDVQCLGKYAPTCLAFLLLAYITFSLYKLDSNIVRTYYFRIKGKNIEFF